ncbi:MAG: hypothetical protein RXP99_03925 [Vulcanisaeta sp.]
MRSLLRCNKTELTGLIECALNAIIAAKLGLVNKDEALDALWEYLVNIDYEVKALLSDISQD